jgi:hypothetical protein
MASGSGLWHRAMRTALLALAVVVRLAQPGAAADAPEIGTLVAKMKAALEPPRSSLRQMQLSISGEDGGTTQWSLAQARKRVEGQARMLSVLLAPASDRGIASLVIDGKPPATALYIPAVRRVRTLTPAGGYETVLGSDFMYADLGFIRLNDKYRYLATEKKRGKDAWKIEETPDNPFFYSKIVAWIDQATMLPIERDYYDPAGQLWKVETFDDVTTIDGQPVALKVTMQDKQTGGTSEIDVSNLRFGADLPDTLFKKDNLPTAAASPVWGGLQ